MAWAASSMTHRPCFSATAQIAAMEQGRPVRCTGMMPFVRGVMAASSFAGSMFRVLGSMSTSTGTPPCRTTVLSVLTQVSEVVITSSPGCRFSTCMVISWAVVALFITRQWGTPL